MVKIGRISVKLQRKQFKILHSSVSMERAETYRREIESLDTELARLRTRIKELNEIKKQKQGYLYAHMMRHDISKVGKITITSITPKEKKTRRSKTEKKNAAISLFYEIGHPNPDELWERLKSTQ